MPTTGYRPRASLCTLGCRLNQSETALIEERLVQAGYRMVPFGEPADLGIVNTCTVTQQADQKCRQAIRSFIRRNPQAYTAVVGCYSQLGYRAISGIEGVDLIIGNQAKLDVLDYVRQGKNPEPVIIRDAIVRRDFTIDYDGEGACTRRANLKIQDGCDFMCSFCVIPHARGRARSRVLDNLLDEARGLVTRGARELVLTGVNLGTYAWEGRSILDVVDALDAVPDLARIRISSIEPTTIPVALFDRMADPAHALLPYLHIPLQSGSDRVLATMRRRYGVAAFVAFVEDAAARVPDLCIGTDVLVGSPGEDEAAFRETCELVAHGPFAYCHVFTYSEREGTAALRLPPAVDRAERRRRNAVVRRLGERKKRAFYRRFIGREAEVLFEDQRGGCWPGYTGNYIRVGVQSPQSLANVVRRVRLTGCTADYMDAELVA